MTVNTEQPSRSLVLGGSLCLLPEKGAWNRVAEALDSFLSSQARVQWYVTDTFLALFHFPSPTLNFSSS